MELSGLAVRPVGSDSYPPAVGTRVAWSAVRPIRDLYAQGKRYGIPCLGILGNDAHLRLHGDHTPWSLGKERGLVWAGDWDLGDGFLGWMIAYCRSSVDTSWIDFWNFRNHLYDYAGNQIRTNPDHHFHLSTDKKDAAVTLFDDYARDTGLSEGNDMNLTDRVKIPGGLAAHYPAAAKVTDESSLTVADLLWRGDLRGTQARVEAEKALAAVDGLTEDVDDVKAAVAALQTAGVDLDALAAKVADLLAVRLAT